MASTRVLLAMFVLCSVHAAPGVHPLEAPPAALPAGCATAGYRPPVSGAVVRAFERPAHPWSPGHRGVDLRAPPGMVVVAPASAEVVFVGPVAGRDVMTLQHPDGLRSSFEPVTATVAVGDRVAAGDPIGVVPATPLHCAGQCLHWGVRRGEEYLDPLSLLPRPTVVLLPVT